MATIPTGYAPLHFGDISGQMGAMTQNLVTLMRDKYKEEQAEEKREKAKSDAAYWKAMDFETLENAGYQVQSELLQDYNKFADKWSRIRMENNNKLSDEQLLEQKKDRRGLDQKLNTYKHGIGQAMLIQKELLRNPHLYDRQSIEDFAKFTQEGNWGKSTLGILKPAFDPAKISADALKNVGLDDIDPRQSVEYYPDGTLKRAVGYRGKSARAIKKTLEGSQSIEYSLQDPEKKQRWENYWEGILKEYDKPVYGQWQNVPEYQQKAAKIKDLAKGLTDHQVKMVEAGAPSQFVKPLDEYTIDVMAFNEFDQPTWDRIISDPENDIDDIRRTKDGNIQTYTRNSSGKLVEKELIKPIDTSDANAVADFAKRHVKTVGAKNVMKHIIGQKGWDKWIDPQIGVETVQRPAEIHEFNKAMEILDQDEIVDVDRTDLKDYINELEGKNIAKSRTGTMTIKNDDGSESKYYLKKKQGKDYQGEELKKWIRDRYGKGAVQEEPKPKPELTDEQKNAPLVKTEAEMNALPPGTLFKGTNGKFYRK